MEEWPIEFFLEDNSRIKVDSCFFMRVIIGYFKSILHLSHIRVSPIYYGAHLVYSQTT